MKHKRTAKQLADAKRLADATWPVLIEQWLRFEGNTLLKDWQQSVHPEGFTIEEFQAWLAMPPIEEKLKRFAQVKLDEILNGLEQMGQVRIEGDRVFPT